MRLVVDAVIPLARAVVEVTLVAQDRGPLPQWTPGAHIEIDLPGGLTRQYSLVGEAGVSDAWRFAVLRERFSRGGSEYLHTALAVGDLITVRGPRNNFRLRTAERYHFIGSGIGITPLLSMVAECERTGRPWTLDYIGRRAEEMAYLDVLPVSHSRVHITSTDGRPDLERLVSLTGSGEAIVYACGSAAVLTALETVLADRPPGTLHTEWFADHTRNRAADALDEFDLVFRRSGATVRVMAAERIVDAADRVGVFIPTSCGMGICGSCECAVADGLIDHRDGVLTETDRLRGDSIMACVSGARSHTLTLDI